MANNENGFNVLDMAQEMADASGVSDIGDFFRNNPVSGNVKAEKEKEDKGTTETPPTPAPIPVQSKRQDWTPSAEAMADLPETHSAPVVYEKSEMIEEDNGPLRNITDDNAIQESREAMDDLTRKQANIEDAKARHGFDKLQIPEGQFHADIFAAAGDTNYKRSQEKLDEIFNLIKNVHPEFILSWLPGYGPEQTPVNDGATAMQDNLAQLPELPPDIPQPTTSTPVSPSATISAPKDENTDVKVIIDKTNVSQVAWSSDEVDKIRRARLVELNIVESKDLPFASIEKVKPNAVDNVLAQYQRKTNDIDAALPASRYRATFTGLSYPEVLDLSNSTEINTIDGERIKWTICFNHIRNQSIGPWETYRYYVDPESDERVRIDPRVGIPENIDDDQVFTHTEFDDFMSKTSFMDLEFMLWKILCATAMDKELISIDCHATTNGVECGHSYDWIYSPNELLLISSVEPAVLEEMKVTAEASTTEEILDNYNNGPLMAKNCVKLPSSGFQLLFGHVSGEEYINGGIYGAQKRYERIEQAKTDPTFISNSLQYRTLTIVKGFLLPKPDDSGWFEITGIDNILKILNELNEIDWQVIDEVCTLMVGPYQFEFALRDIVCPKCNNRSSIPIESMSHLLFIVARSLSNVQVELKRT